MDLDLINTIIKHTLLLALACLVIASIYIDFSAGSSIFLGALWGCCNVFLIKYTVQELLGRQPKSYLKLYSLFCLKFPLLYLTGYGLLKIDDLLIEYIIIGFSLVFLTIFLTGLKILVLDQLDKRFKRI